MISPIVGWIVQVPVDPDTNAGCEVAPGVVVRVLSPSSVDVRVFRRDLRDELREQAGQVDVLPGWDPGQEMNVWCWPPRV